MNNNLNGEETNIENNKEPKNNNKMIILLITLGTVILALIGYLIYNKINDNIKNEQAGTGNDDKVIETNTDAMNVSMSFELEQIEIEKNYEGTQDVNKMNLKQYLILNNVDINDIEFSLDSDEYGYIEDNYFIAKSKEGKVELTAKYKDIVATMKISLVMFYTRIDTKIIYFYDNDGKLEYIGGQGGEHYTNYSEAKKREYDNSYKYLGKYECNGNCNVAIGQSSQCSITFDYNVSDENVFIVDSDKTISYNFIKNNVIETYDFARNFFGKVYMLVEKNDKVALININGKQLSSYYDNIANFIVNDNGISYVPNTVYKYQLVNNSISLGVLSRLCNNLDISLKNDIATYKKDNKYGIISLTDGKEITAAIYDEITITDDSIVATLNNLEYTLDINGDIITRTE